MDIQPQDINPEVVKIARSNPAIRQVMEAYLFELPTDSDQPLTWVQALEMMVIRLSEQSKDRMLGWKNAADKLEVAVPPKSPLVNENPLLLDGREINKAQKTGIPCQTCGYDAWIVDAAIGKPRCGVCEGDRRRRNYQMTTKLLHDAIEETFKTLHTPIPDKVLRLLAVKP